MYSYQPSILYIQHPKVTHIKGQNMTFTCFDRTNVEVKEMDHQLPVISRYIGVHKNPLLCMISRHIQLQNRNNSAMSYNPVGKLYSGNHPTTQNGLLVHGMIWTTSISPVARNLGIKFQYSLTRQQVLMHKPIPYCVRATHDPWGIGIELRTYYNTTTESIRLLVLNSTWDIPQLKDTTHLLLSVSCHMQSNMCLWCQMGCSQCHQRQMGPSRWCTTFPHSQWWTASGQSLQQRWAANQKRKHAIWYIT